MALVNSLAFICVLPSSINIEGTGWTLVAASKASIAYKIDRTLVAASKASIAYKIDRTLVAASKASIAYKIDRTLVAASKASIAYKIDTTGRDHMVVAFTTTYAISAYNHKRCEVESGRSWRGVLNTTLCDKVCQ
jgi:hypothetical protein